MIALLQYGLGLLTGILFVLILVYLQLLRMRKIVVRIRQRNKVVVPSLTVVADKASYLHGDTVTISGTLIEDNAPVAAQTFSLKLPDGTTQNVTTDAQGNYSTTWVVPDTLSGVLSVLAGPVLGITATTTFTLKSCEDEQDDEDADYGWNP
jgi:hypothetical protein